MINYQTKCKIHYSKKFAKQLKKIQKGGNFSKKDYENLQECITKLANLEKLDEKYKDHKLTNHPNGVREFHFKPDLLIIYSYIENKLILSLAEIGSHSEIF